MPVNHSATGCSLVWSMWFSPTWHGQDQARIVGRSSAFFWRMLVHPLFYQCKLLSIHTLGVDSTAANHAKRAADFGVLPPWSRICNWCVSLSKEEEGWRMPWQEGDLLKWHNLAGVMMLWQEENLLRSFLSICCEQFFISCRTHVCCHLGNKVWHITECNDVKWMC